LKRLRASVGKRGGQKREVRGLGKKEESRFRRGGRGFPG